MARKFLVLVVSVVFLANVYGCVAILAGAAGGAGTAHWLGGKLTKELGDSADDTLAAARSALTAMELPIDKEIRSDEVIQLKSTYTDGRTIWIDIKPLTRSTSEIGVRVGAISDQDVSREILEKILSYL